MRLRGQPVAGVNFGKHTTHKNTVLIFIFLDCLNRSVVVLTAFFELL